ncbi:NUDIX hydrolase [Lactococcus termiticola]|uniref:NUDIX family hydrolase n=1 Tax=Lactococcus termiticola TaxID=2169526 RepID=A0A2R5HEY0_9LACT|nr:NUDIX hydrolase [Lactococcus termiticola]GBG96396.1 NUDIX family hydrolase [Lactococcus termiticola]
MAEGYVMDLRKKIGHIPMVIACASVITYDEEKGILLQRRKDNGNWCYHGGSIEPGETAQEAAAREMLEEVGLKAGKMELYDVVSGEEQHFFYPNGDEVYIIDSVYLCKDFEGDLKLEAAEVTDVQWFAFDDLPENLMPSTKTPIQKFAKEMLDAR